MMSTAVAALPPYKFDLDVAIASLQDMFEERYKELE